MRPYLFDRSHWRVTHMGSMPEFFRELGVLVPDGSILALADGAWPDDVLAWFALNKPSSVPEPCGPTGEFTNAHFVVVSQKSMAELARLAESHAGPEIAIHLGVFHEGNSLVEWFDAPDDPLSVAVSIPEAAVRSFANRTGAECVRIERGV